MVCSGENPATHLVEVVELPGKRWYLGTQYHPEYSSTVLNPNPLFMSFVKAATEYAGQRTALIIRHPHPKRTKTVTTNPITTDSWTKTLSPASY